jgi:hypothetical protein
MSPLTLIKVFKFNLELPITKLPLSQKQKIKHYKWLLHLLTGFRMYDESFREREKNTDLNFTRQKSN